jgi:hypothetical protein
MNYNALNFWVVGMSLGYAIGDLHGCAIGLAVTASLTFIINMLP